MQNPNRSRIWTRQPPGQTPIDLTHEVGKRIRYAHLFTGIPGRNAAPFQYPYVVAGGPTWEIVDKVAGLAFNGTSGVNYITGIPHYPQFSWAGRVVLGSTIETSPYGAIAGKHTTNGNPSDWFLYWSPVDSKFHVDIPWVAGDVFTSTGTYTTGVPYSIVFVRAGTPSNWTYRLYVNGVLDRETTGGSSNPNTSSHTYNLGALNSFGDNAHNIKYAYAYLIEGQLTESQARALHLNPWQVFKRRETAVFFGAGLNSYTYAGSGGFTLAGTAALTRNRSYLPTGGFTAAGVAPVARGKVYDPSGGIVFAGAAPTESGTGGLNSYIYAGSGGFTFAGAAPLARNRSWLPDGGLSLAGVAALLRNRSYLPSGGISFGGHAASESPDGPAVSSHQLNPMMKYPGQMMGR